MRNTHAAAPRRPSACATDHGQRTTDKLGFTLLEVLIVIVILTILIGLLVPVLSSGRVKVHEAQVRTEIKQLETAMASFRSNHSDVLPPSRITLYERGDTSANGWLQNTPEARRSRMVVGKIWPQFDFTLAGGQDRTGAPTPGRHDINGDGDADDTITLTGAECLVFFLGGIQDLDASTNPPEFQGMIGFAKNPANPFARPILRNGVKEYGNRFAPDFAFDTSRLTKTTDRDDVDNDGIAEYFDPLTGQTAPYVYVSNSYGGYALNATQRAGQTDDLDVFPNGQSNNRNMKDIYRQGSAAGAPAWNPKSFQIISAGIDFEYGSGGEYDPNKAASLLMTPARIAEKDNLTNFHGERLLP